MDTSHASYGRGRGRGGHSLGGRGRGRGSKICSYCSKIGHMVDTCYKKHGYPPHLQWGGAINQYSLDDQEIEDDLQSLGQKEVAADTSSTAFTPEQHKALLSLLQQTSQASSSHTTNQLISFHKNGNSGIFCATLHAYSSNINSWVLDSGAIDHVCFSQTQFQCLKQIRPILVKLPDGSQICLVYSFFHF